MKYQVAWTSDAEADLATVWVQASDRVAVAEAANKLDAFLAHDPSELGESRRGIVRILFEAPLAIEFEVVEITRTAYVLAVWSFRRREGSD